MPKISVIVPVYNAEKYLCDCIDSILTQTFDDFELLLIDDGSKDSSGEICEEYAKNDNRIRVFHQTNQGQAAARNFGVKQAESEWIHFVDSDDIIHSQMLEVLYRIAELNNASICVSSVVEARILPSFFVNEISPEGSCLQIDENSMMSLYEKIPYIYWIACAKLIKKEIVLKHPFTCGRVYEDNAVVCRWLYEAKTISVTEAKLYFYRINPASTTNREFNIKRCDFLWALQKQIEFFKKVKYCNLLEKICSRYLATYSVFYNKLKIIDVKKSYVAKLRIQCFLFWFVNVQTFVKKKSDLIFALETFFPKQYSILFKTKKL